MRTTLVSLLALAATTPAFASSNPSQPATNAEGETIVVTASRSNEGIAADRLGASVTVLDAQAIEQRQTRVVSDVLRDVPGVAVSRAIGGLTQIRLRGSEANHALVLIDGIEASDPFNGEFDFNGLIADQDVRIEVLRGQQSSLYGSDAIGGVVHYLTLSGAEAPGFTARAEGGSFNTFDGAARFAGATDQLDYVVSGGYYRTDGTPVARNGKLDVGSETAGANVKLAWTPSESFKLTGVARYMWNDYDVANTEQNPASPLFGYVVDSPGARATKESLYGLLRAELTALDGRWVNALTGQYADVTRKGYAGALRDSGSNGRRYKGSFESSLRFGDEVVVHKLTGALDVEREEFQNTTPGGFAFTGRRNTTNVGLVGQYELTVDDNASFGASIRQDWNNRFADSTTWRVQGSYTLPTDTRVHAAYGTGVKNPGYFELYGFVDGQYIGNPNLRPEKSEGWEAGLEQRFGTVATIGATWSDNRLKGEIFTTFPAPTFIATPANRTTKSRQRGIEVALSAQPVPQWRIDATYTWLDADENGTVEVRRAKHIASFNSTWTTADDKLSATLTVRYNGRQQDVAFTDPSFVPVNVTLDDYVLVNLNAEYKLTGAITLFGRVENLFDENYEEVFSYATPGAAAYGGVRVKF
ncbi:TonB-dependent receptor plug domain-containing protein [Novosphingobium sp. JCM 18896]|uniref:TonB-dependent receptor plug domain-containing protein n=1 Tax=Novosphingobium sp. JCM 18896 TaxID=2989731 RepID=UPI002221C5C9|nr:TonB-dependent receptor [Novosphingobium sp. JCM 18896]MCW1428701.1 TonB-dependent receptor [Novosphingobium sp. JCM 18896]